MIPGSSNEATPAKNLLFSQTEKKIQQDYLYSKNELERRAGLDITSAKALLGFFMHEGEKGFFVNKSAARSYIEFAAKDATSAAGLFSLGLCYEFGYGVASIKDDKEAMKYYEKSARQGYVPAIFGKANLLYKVSVKEIFVFFNEYTPSKELELDHAKLNEILRLLEVCKNSGYTPALALLGYCYAYGIGVKQNRREALRLYELAADQGSGIAKKNIGLLYEYGCGEENIDLTKARTWYQAAISQGIIVESDLVRLSQNSCVIL